VLSNGAKNICPKHQASDCFQIAPQYLVDVKTNEQFPLSWLKHKEIHAVAGIGNPQRFFSLLKELGSKPICHPFVDHHEYQMSDIPNDKKSLVVTEKDAVKLEQFQLLDCFYLKIRAELPQTFYSNLNAFLKQASLKYPQVKL
jgi:tetraacyldisaccharide 4'-kinase